MTTPPWCREKVMVYYYYGRMHVMVNYEPLEEVESQVAAGGGWGAENE